MRTKWKFIPFSRLSPQGKQPQCLFFCTDNPAPKATCARRRGEMNRKNQKCILYPHPIPILSFSSAPFAPSAVEKEGCRARFLVPGQKRNVSFNPERRSVEFSTTCAEVRNLTYFRKMVNFSAFSPVNRNESAAPLPGVHSVAYAISGKFPGHQSS